MKRSAITGIVLLGASALPVPAADIPAASGASVYPAVTGAGYYVEYCAACHGTDGRGDGPVGPGLTVPPPTLRTLTAMNGGVFPVERVRSVIDGRDLPATHGTREMPIWGEALKRSQGAYGERRVQERIDLLVEYLRGLQDI